MRKLDLPLATCFPFTLVFVVQNNIVKSLGCNVPGQDKISTHQGARIEALIGSEYIPTGSGDQKVIKSSSYRAQVHTSNNTRQVRDEVYLVASDIKERFPDFPVYTSSSPPCQSHRTSDFRSIEEVNAMMCQLRTTGVFGEVSIVRDQIDIPL